MTRNARASLQMRARCNPMSACDRLPPELRRWLAEAALPWSARLTLRIWHRALRGDGSPEAAVARLLPLEVTMVTRDAARILGAPNLSASGFLRRAALPGLSRQWSWKILFPRSNSTAILAQHPEQPSGGDILGHVARRHLKQPMPMQRAGDIALGIVDTEIALHRHRDGPAVLLPIRTTASTPSDTRSTIRSVALISSVTAG